MLIQDLSCYLHIGKGGRRERGGEKENIEWLNMPKMLKTLTKRVRYHGYYWWP
jgi:hypothetical protein